MKEDLFPALILDSAVVVLCLWCLSDFHLLGVGLLGRQRARLFVQGVDDGPVAADLLGHVLVLLHQSLSGELVVADVHAGDDPQHVQHPRVDVVGISLQGENEKFNIIKHSNNKRI